MTAVEVSCLSVLALHWKIPIFLLVTSISIAVTTKYSEISLLRIPLYYSQFPVASTVYHKNPLFMSMDPLGVSMGLTDN